MFEDIAALIEQSGVAFPKPGNGVRRAAIDNAEKALGVALPASFKWWLLNYGCGQIGGDLVYGLDEGGNGMADIVELRRAFYA